MKPSLRRLLLTLGLAAVAAGAGAFVCARFVIDHHDRPASLHDIVHEQLGLTPDQVRRLEQIEARYAGERARLEGEVRLANRELATTIRDGDKNSPAVNAAIDHLHMSMGALQKATVAHVFDMREVLDEDQRRTFDAEVTASLTREAR